MSKAPEPPAEPAPDGLKSGASVRPSGGSEADAWVIPSGGFDSYREAAVHLRRPFAPAAVKFKVQTIFGKDKPQPTGCLIVAYIDARLTVERLNLLVPHLWSANYHAVSDAKHLLCRLTIDGITREDVGESGKGFSKDLVSDALKRAAVHFGVGVSLYAIPQMKLFKEHIENGNLKVTKRWDAKANKEVASLEITDKGDKKLRDGYARWLDTHGTRNFGPALDHGDQEGHMDSPEAAVPETAPDPKADAAAEKAARDYQATVRDAA